MLTLTPIAGFAIAFGLAFLITPMVRQLAIRRGLVDQVTRTKIHAKDIPRLGGIAIAVAFFVPLIGLVFRVNVFSRSLYSEPYRMIAFLGGGFAIFALGVYDDLYGATALKKLCIQIPVAVFAWFAGLRIGGASGLAGTMTAFPMWLSLMATVGWIVLVINAINLIDGLDGLASGIALQALLTTAICAGHRDEPVLLLLALCLSGSVAGFLFHNFHPASIFMGDSGSMFLGYALATGSIWSSQKAATAIGTVLPIIVLAIPLLDTSLAVWRRFWRGQPLFSGDLDHIHHRMLALGGTQKRSVLLLYAIGFIFNGLSVVLIFSNNRRAEWALITLALVLAIGFARWLGYMNPATLESTMTLRKHNLMLRRALSELETRLSKCESEDEYVEALANFEALVRPHFESKKPVCSATK